MQATRLSKSTIHHSILYEFTLTKYEKLTTNWTIRQYSQNKQHFQYKKHHLFSPRKPLTWSKTTTYHSSNLDTQFYNLRELRSRFYSPFSNPNVCPQKEKGKLQTSCHSCKSEVTITHYHWKLKSGYNKHARWSTEWAQLCRE